MNEANIPKAFLQFADPVQTTLSEVSCLGQLSNMLLLLFLIRTSNLLTAGTQTLDLDGQASHIWDCYCHLRHVTLTVGAAGSDLRCGHFRSGTEMGKKQQCSHS